MPYFNKSLHTFQCYPILEKGPCEPNYWFVLNADTLHEAHCVEQPCDIFDYDYSDNIVYNDVMFDGSCHEIQDTEACPDGQEILPNPYGQGK